MLLYKHEYRKLLFNDLESLRPYFFLSALVTVLLQNLIRREDRLLNHILLFWHQAYWAINYGLFDSKKMESPVAIQNNVYLGYYLTVSFFNISNYIYHHLNKSRSKDNENIRRAIFWFMEIRLVNHPKC